ncbi:zinc-dependent metalloprotease [Cellulomonas shaoxiangyii]|uniref:Zinc-dependent metalloprotease n=1 Tax=Cellulomonas shaoxiangyii TaxID=2566013 RepID=A0A4P7SHP6_9CELL|nr:zinc-dependent metalloprotease [Cellulomonas shaoxiangyii]QCB93047.1 zinc-dependent metalloprotease [Cellulomonas shaoxiangyii]TGY84684.1 zinc-dependent metalloprotease [Cellulomonas shaoxiangyii]
MSPDVTPGGPQQPDPEQWEQVLRAMLGPAADDAIAQMRAMGVDPSAMAAASGLPADPAALQAAIAQVQRMLATSGDEPVNWGMAHDLARQQAAQGGDPSLSPGRAREVIDALAVAELWLDAATDLPPSSGRPRAWSRAEWVEATLPTWRTLTEPVAVSLSAALADALRPALGDGPDGVLDLPGLPAGMPFGDPVQLLRGLGSAVFGLQVGQAAGTLAREVFGTTDIGLPLLDRPAPALVPTNVDAFAEGLDAPLEEVRLYLALREAAANRLFAHVPWLRAHLLDAVAAYARGIEIDVDQLEEAVRSIDPTDQTALQEALSGGVFAPRTTPTQQAALARLELALALVEGWVDEVATAAAAPHLPHAVALREMVRRRRAAGGPAEQTFASLVGLELRPRRLRDAAAVWAHLATTRGIDGRDAVWAHPDLVPTSQDLDDPAGYDARRQAEVEGSADLDRALAEILGDADGTVDGGARAGTGSGPGAADASDDEARDGSDGPSDDERPGGPVTI